MCLSWMINKIGLYIHIPFCVKKCNYCDFLSAPASEKERAAYVGYIKEEIRAYKSCNYCADTIFFGGGTPSLLSTEEFEELMREIRVSFYIEPQAEITVECNPETVDKDKLSAMRQMGINRISFGLQSAIDNELKLLGRIHSYERFVEAYRTARCVGFDNINIDLMSAIPGQTEDSWERTLREVISLKPEHISAYSLILEEGTEFYERQEELALPGEEEERRMYYRTKELLAQAGYMRYEISNYAKSSFACRHNCKYWSGQEYIGLGLGASSYLRGTRFHNPTIMKEYSRVCMNLSALRREEEKLSAERQMEEYCFLGLRLTEGVSKKNFEERFGIPIRAVYKDVLEYFLNLKLIKEQGDRVFLTDRGIDVSNQVFAAFLLE